MRGLLREYGVVIPQGAAKVSAAVRDALEYADNEVPMALRATLAEQLDRIATLQADMAAIEKRLAQEAGHDVAVQRYAPGGSAFKREECWRWPFNRAWATDWVHGARRGRRAAMPV